MNILGVDVNFPFWSRTRSGENFYDLLAFQKWAKSGDNLSMAQDHPILTPALLFVSKLFSQAELWVENAAGEKQENHDLMELFRYPNWFQTMPDLLESLMFMQIANGVGVLYTKRTLGMGKPNALYVLDYKKITWPTGMDKGNFVNGSSNEKMLETEVIYDKGGEDLKIKLRDLLFFYDLPNAVSKNPFQAKSRIDGLTQTLLNTHDSLSAKNIILRSNGKEMITGNKDGFPLTEDEKSEAESLFNNNYGLSPTRKRGLITKANINWKSLHIALRDLGLDESIKIDGNLIYTALHIPKDILSLEAKKTTYNNFKESMVSYVQNEMQATLKSTCAVFNKIIGDGYKLNGSFEHLPIMQYILLERYEGITKQAEALTAMRKAGLPDEIALERCGFDKKTKLGPLVESKPNDDGKGQEDNKTKTSTLPEEESKIRQLIAR